MVAPMAEAAIPFALAAPGPVDDTRHADRHRPADPRLRAQACLHHSRLWCSSSMEHSDFIIGLPALRDLRQTFPDAYIRLVCGSWNVASACADRVVRRGAIL